MHFKLDPKEKKMLMKKKKVMKMALLLFRPLPALFVLFWRTLQSLWVEEERLEKCFCEARLECL